MVLRLSAALFDFVVIGAGTAGCLVANRCVERGARVLLIEAGRDTPPSHVPADIADLYPRSYFNSAYMWPALQAKQRAGDSKPTDFPQARVMGGGSSLMGMIALKGLPHNYDRWEQAGARGWGWNEVAPVFPLVESGRDCAGPEGKETGSVSIRRHRAEDWPPLATAVGEASARMGFPMLNDFNRQFGDGYGSLSLSATLSQRVSAASAFLDEPVRAKKNLTVICDATVTKLLVDRGRCSGVEIAVGQSTHVVRSLCTIVCGGAIHSPALLMRSGIGAEQSLRRIGIQPKTNLPGVGQNLQNHPIVYLAAYLKPGGRQDPSLRPGFTTALRLSSEMDGGSQGDLMIYVLNKSSWHGVGHATAGLGVILFDPRSRGALTIRDADPSIPPDVDFQMLSEAGDAHRLGRGFSVAAELMATSEVRALRHEVFVAGYTKVVRGLNQPGWRNAAVTRLLAGMLDGPPSVRRTMLRIGIAGRDLSEDRLRNTAWLTTTAANRAFGTYHPAGTCAIGPADDPRSVVSPTGAVHGVQGLYVADASIMPFLPSANTFLPTLMVAQKVVDGILT